MSGMPETPTRPPMLFRQAGITIDTPMDTIELITLHSALLEHLGTAELEHTSGDRQAHHLAFLRSTPAGIKRIEVEGIALQYQNIDKIKNAYIALQNAPKDQPHDTFHTP